MVTSLWGRKETSWKPLVQPLQTVTNRNAYFKAIHIRMIFMIERDRKIDMQHFAFLRSCGDHSQPNTDISQPSVRQVVRRAAIPDSACIRI